LCSTFPPLNILLYNSIVGNGDELYGVEPASYYIKNLLLTLGFAVPLALLNMLVFVVLAFRSYLMGEVNNDTFLLTLTEATIILSVFLWLSLLFSRPHKVDSLFC
jgi:alpha-1,2-mannosyltransferase